jgi:hypothetical protein
VTPAKRAIESRATGYERNVVPVHASHLLRCNQTSGSCSGASAPCLGLSCGRGPSHQRQPSRGSGGQSWTTQSDRRIRSRGSGQGASVSRRGCCSLYPSHHRVRRLKAQQMHGHRHSNLLTPARVHRLCIQLSLTACTPRHVPLHHAEVHVHYSHATPPNEFVARRTLTHSDQLARDACAHASSATRWGTGGGEPWRGKAPCPRGAERARRPTRREQWPTSL